MSRVQKSGAAALTAKSSVNVLQGLAETLSLAAKSGHLFIDACLEFFIFGGKFIALFAHALESSASRVPLGFHGILGSNGGISLGAKII